MTLNEIANWILAAKLEGDGNVQITGLNNDSRSVQPGTLFFCLPGYKVDGHDFAAAAASNGAAALVVERKLDVAIPQLIVKDSRLAMAIISDRYYDHPSQKLRLIGVTGTNGKTTTTYLIERILSDAGQSAGVIGTIETRYAGNTLPMSGTTPGALELQQYLAAMAEAGVDSCAMEVSSHALDQGRTWGCRFRIGVFTNLTQDHLDYHGTMEKYAAAKSLLFSRLGNTYSEAEAERSYAVLNADDSASDLFANAAAVEILTYGIDREADVRASDIRITSRGTTFRLETFRGGADISIRMVGKFNVYNALAATSVALLEGISIEAIKQSLEALPGVPGRVESVDAGQPYAVIVDYAHTPDGLENVLRTVKEFVEGRIICVFGCGGDRDRTKRPIMGRIAAKYADICVITSDNPRSENPHAILLDVEEGLKADGIPSNRYLLIEDRRHAIEKAVEMASPGDVVLIAGKGHETYQIIGPKTFDFDDRLVAEEAIRGTKS
ncbi:UDP-N-acetylmuramyl-tripeptide synthetase [Paenibacillus curdlanolyticus YK9]|uniref:UDP-N-acetylmuramoyl-L-alanyl-D-glutamate--2,6-diaminopimelate ligase n=1 Tax=Paenibacillus curdlanolyticus YK9 TaxID=717606 RepID=E0I3F1_9BACL|nr:UDP-N-acetylmuramoyl-L-alanyl-D-glutamate--2,6-diaminopimelate ligase [Paenibacillus curdlanolyticus]EFM12815.1 UDP-N-acetylmuramyl-tripeptide synthetase [Paenibacillus curdlanolyticus YK9]